MILSLAVSTDESQAEKNRKSNNDNNNKSIFSLRRLPGTCLPTQKLIPKRYLQGTWGHCMSAIDHPHVFIDGFLVSNSPLQHKEVHNAFLHVSLFSPGCSKEVNTRVQ